MIRILVADDEAMLRGALVALLALEEDLTVVAEVDSSDRAVTEAAESRPDIAVLDLEMPPADGLVAAEQILRDPKPPRIIMVTRHARPGVLRRALSVGVSAFVPKTTPAEQLAAIIRDVHAGRRYVDPDIAASALTEDECPLTARELEVLREARTGSSIAEISSKVHLASGTVRNYLSSAMTKLGVSSRHAAAHAAWEQGWI
ncbi:MAG: response regulator transcription factor [Stackebrandtia sp.]